MDNNKIIDVTPYLDWIGKIRSSINSYERLKKELPYQPLGVQLEKAELDALEFNLKTGLNNNYKISKSIFKISSDKKVLHLLRKYQILLTSKNERLY